MDISLSFVSLQHRNSVVDEWNIPYSDIRIIELLGRDPVAELYRGYWHGEVAIKRFYLPNATPEQISWFKEEVRGQGGCRERERKGEKTVKKGQKKEWQGKQMANHSLYNVN